jgi:putative polysaccharide biosynthesis protein
VAEALAVNGMSSALDVERAAGAPIPAQLEKLKQASGLSYNSIIKSFVKLAWGPGKISFADFVRLRLFDSAFHDGSSLTDYIGQRSGCLLCVAVNYRQDWYCLLSNKVAAFGYLSNYGLPTIPIKAIFSPGLRADSTIVLSDRHALEIFLSSPGHFPLFGKPVEGIQSLGTIGLRSTIQAGRQIETVDGQRIPLDRLMSDIETHYRTGYIFQPLIHPHERIAAVCGDRIACVRLLTITTETGPKVIRGCWKIPCGRNTADNYWRAGNLLGQVSMESGRILRVSSGAGLEARDHVTHPDTGAALIGFELPRWNEAKQLALEGARAMRNVPLIGWDIALTDKGPVIVEMNETPDFFLVQFADRKGILDDEFRAFMAFQAKRAAAYKKEIRASIEKL